MAVFVVTTAASASADPRDDLLIDMATAEQDRLGFSASIDGDTAVVGALLDDGAATDAGAVHVFVRNGSSWSSQAVLRADDAATGDRLGFAVAIRRDRVVAGAPEHKSGAGVAYVFEREADRWHQVAKLVPEGLDAEAKLGSAVALADDVIAIGAPGDAESGKNSGAVYMFRLQDEGWVEEGALRNDTMVAHHELGAAVALSGGRLLAGAPGIGETRERPGSAYIFEWTGMRWRREAALLPSDPAMRDAFGRAVALDGTHALVGSPQDDDDGESSGSVYVFAHDGQDWIQKNKLTAEDAAMDDGFGTSVSLSGDTALVGAYLDDDAGRNSGAAYIFRRSDEGWFQHGKLLAERASAGDRVGEAVALSQDTAVLGAPFDNATGPGSGSAWVHVIEREAGEPCSANAQCIDGMCANGTCCTTDCPEETRDAGVDGADASTATGSDGGIGPSSDGGSTPMDGGDGGCNCRVDGDTNAGDLELGWLFFGLLAVAHIARRRRAS